MSETFTRRLLPEAAFPLLPPIVLAVVFGPYDALFFGIPVGLLAFFLCAAPWRIEVGDGTVRLDSFRSG